MAPYAQLAAATFVFLALHFLSSTPLRTALVARLGERPYRGLYSLVALASFVWICVTYAAAPHELLWPGLRHLPIAVMPFAFLLLACGAGPSPTAVGGERLLKSDRPARGIVRVTRHPIMWAIMLWSAAHLLARGDVKAVIFFGGLFVLAAAGTLLMDRRKSGNPDWARFAALTSHVPFLAIAQGRNRLVWREIGWTRPLAGLAAFAVFLAIHPWLFGVRPY